MSEKEFSIIETKYPILEIVLILPAILAFIFFTDEEKGDPMMILWIGGIFVVIIMLFINKLVLYGDRVCLIFPLMGLRNQTIYFSEIASTCSDNEAVAILYLGCRMSV